MGTMAFKNKLIFSIMNEFQKMKMALYAGRQFIDLYSQIIFNKH